MKRVFIVFLLIFTFCLTASASVEVGGVLGDPLGVSFAFKDFQSIIGQTLDNDPHWQVDYKIITPPLEYKYLIGYYIGAGAFLTFEDEDTQFGLRIPVGININTKDRYWTAFAEVALALTVSPSSKTNLHWGVGARYVF